MTTSNAVDITRHNFDASDSLLIDANVWLFIYGPQGDPSDPRAKVYSGQLKRILSAKSRILMDVLILSEFINRYARLEYDLVSYALPYKTFKEFRNSQEFKPVAKRIADDSRRIVGLCECVETAFSKLDVHSLLADYEAGDCDFNDKVLSKLCRTNRWAFVTHDADFRSEGLFLLTANKRLLSRP